MGSEALLTLREIAVRLGIPESTARFYRDSFLDSIPVVGTGRRRRYPAAALKVMRTIAEAFAAGGTRGDVAARLNGSPAARRAAAPRAIAKPVSEVSNLELLAAIVDGERQQREAMWQMAREIVRLGEVLEGQERVLGAIAERTGIATQQLALAAGATSSANSDPATDAPPSFPSLPSLPSLPSSDSLLRAELEAERKLVERLRESRLQLERRAAEAEAALEDSRGWRSSVLKRLLGRDGA
jgi:DNA-binding transcriptional MerR regulator